MDSSPSLPQDPTPDSVATFVPYACSRLGAPFRVRFKTEVQAEYISVLSAKDTKKSMVAQSTMFAHPKEDSGMEIVADPYDADHSEMFVLLATTNPMNHLTGITFRSRQKIPRMLIKIISFCIPFNPYLYKITLHCRLSGDALYETVKMVRASHITEIYLDDSRVLERNYYMLLDNPTRLQLLSLARCNITDDDCALLIPKLAYPNPASKTLNSLILSSNFITYKGACMIAQVLRSNRTLMYLNLSGNLIGDAGATAICSSLVEFPLTSEEIIAKRKRALYYFKLRKEIYDKCVNDLKALPLLSSSDKCPSKRRCTTVPTIRRKQSVSLSSANDMIMSADLIEVKANKMTNELIDQFPDPFRIEATLYRDNIVYSTGNLSLCYLNIAYNKVGYKSVVKLVEVMRYQSLVAKHPDLGLFGVQLEGNPVPLCDELVKLSDMLAQALKVRIMYAAPPQVGRRGERPKKK